MPRLANDSAFKMDELIGHRLLELLGYTGEDDDSKIAMLFMRISNDGHWHRVFLDAGIGFWETWPEGDAFSDFADFRRLDLGSRWKILGQTILSAECCGTDGPKVELSEFHFNFASGDIVFRFSNPDDLNSASVLEFRPKASGA